MFKGLGCSGAFEIEPFERIAVLGLKPLAKLCSGKLLAAFRLPPPKFHRKTLRAARPFFCA